MSVTAAGLTLGLAPFALDLDDLGTVVRGIASDPSLWRPRLQFRSDGRWWTRLHADHVLDVWLLTWLADQTTDLHDHGGSAAAFVVVEGALEEIRAEPGADLTRAVAVTGETCTVAPGVVHDVRNPTGVPAVSIHAYSPPLREMTYYRRSAAADLVVDKVVARELEP
jgi:mannose-6-phosphate isomerase-like protein (cupin superfamily)